MALNMFLSGTGYKRNHQNLQTRSNAIGKLYPVIYIYYATVSMCVFVLSRLQIKFGQVAASARLPARLE